MKITSQDDVLKLDVRARAIAEILGEENLRRKREAYKRYLCYKDLTPIYVREKLLCQFTQTTVDQMEYAMSNIAFVRKIIDKIARVYSFGVKRDVKDNKKLKDAIDFIEQAFSVNSLFKKTNRFLELEKNCVQYIVPVKSEIPGEDEKKTLLPRVLLPFVYDVIEDAQNQENPIAYILSDFSVTDRGLTRGIYGNNQYIKAASDGTPRTANAWIPKYESLGDGVDQTIADSAHDSRKQCEPFIWWTNKYHFTTNEKGEILNKEGQPYPDQNTIPEDEIKNPIELMPFVNYAKDQDGSFWAIGGSDLTSGAVLLNALITHIIHLGVVQGYGQLVLTGKDLPKNLNIGPTQAVTLEWQNKDDPKPEFTYHSANPPLAELKQVVEMYVALLLTSNNLSTSGVASQLGGGTAFQSGIAIMLDKAESIEDVKDQRQVFLDKELRFWSVMFKWIGYLKSSNQIESKLSMLPSEAPSEMSHVFGEPHVIQTESERIESIKAKKDLGLSTQLDLMMDLYPDLSEDQAKEKLKLLLEEKMQAVLDAQQNMIPTTEEESQDGSEEDGGNQQPNELNNRSGAPEDDESGDQEPSQT